MIERKKRTRVGNQRFQGFNDQSNIYTRCDIQSYSDQSFSSFFSSHNLKGKKKNEHYNLVTFSFLFDHMRSISKTKRNKKLYEIKRKR